jgi:tRNA dimethylallyltransferase
MKKVIILLGPTGVGKTAVSLLLAKTLNSEIISADSMQIYRHMNIGTAKPSVEEQRMVKHHMIDVVEPWESYSTGEYIKDVRPIIEGLHRQEKVPVIVGGTGLYIKAMTRGIFSGPSADWEMRDSLLEKEKAGPGSLYALLQSLDPSAAGRIMPADFRRIIRALEVCMKSDSTMSELQLERTKPLPYEFVKIGLARHRSELYRMIEKRVDVMMGQGLLEEIREVIRLIEEHGPTPGVDSYPSLQAIGYKEIVLHLSGALSIEEAVALVKQRTRNYAKRQVTWFKREEGIRWMDITGVLDSNEIFQQIKEMVPSLL